MMGLYIANEVTVDMGPTCIVPESQYYEVDRLHWSTLGTHKEPPALTTDPGRESWEAECSRVGRVMASADPAARDRMIERTGTFFGSERVCTIWFSNCPMEIQLYAAYTHRLRLHSTVLDPRKIYATADFTM